MRVEEPIAGISKLRLIVHMMQGKSSRCENFAFDEVYTSLIRSARTGYVDDMVLYGQNIME